MEGEHNLGVTIHLQDERGILVFVSGSGRYISKNLKSGMIKAKCIIPGNLLNMGTFTINRLLLVKDRGYVVFEYPDALTFEVTMGNIGQTGWMGKKEGVVRPKLEWELEQITKD
jgi:lipopolysaccharide transport system ATP-binding protein